MECLALSGRSVTIHLAASNQRYRVTASIRKDCDPQEYFPNLGGRSYMTVH